jgi:hypothetical protein
MKIHAYDFFRPGFLGGRPAPVRPGSGPLPGGVRPPENAAPTSENPVSETPIRLKTFTGALKRGVVVGVGVVAATRFNQRRPCRR